MPRLSLPTLAAALLPALAAAQSAPDEIREALVGNTFQGDMDGIGYASYFAADGTYRDALKTGPYEITDEGVCYPESEFGCYAAELDGDRLQWLQDGQPAGAGTILDGNPLGY